MLISSAKPVVDPPKLSESSEKSPGKVKKNFLGHVPFQTGECNFSFSYLHLWSCQNF